MLAAVLVPWLRAQDPQLLVLRCQGKSDDCTLFRRSWCSLDAVEMFIWRAETLYSREVVKEKLRGLSVVVLSSQKLASCVHVTSAAGVFGSGGASEFLLE